MEDFIQTIAMGTLGILIGIMLLLIFKVAWGLAASSTESTPCTNYENLRVADLPVRCLEYYNFKP